MSGPRKSRDYKNVADGSLRQSLVTSGTFACYGVEDLRVPGKAVQAVWVVCKRQKGGS